MSDILHTCILNHLNDKPYIRRWVVAFSGGLDSSVLLHLVVAANQCLPEPRLVLALHINHQLSPNSDTWQAHCQNQANRLACDFLSYKVEVKPQGQGMEAAAREARYAVFAECLLHDDLLFTGHQQDDQAETLLLRLMRGSGVHGLAAIPYFRTVGKAGLIRPLLNFSRTHLAEYARQKGLSYIEDESNQNEGFDRNYLRHQVLPRLEQRWPDAKSRIALSAEHMHKSQGLLDDLAALDMQSLSHRAERYGSSVDWLALKKLSPPRIENVIRHWCAQMRQNPPNKVQLEQIQQQLLCHDTSQTQALVTWSSVDLPTELRQFQQRLYLLPGLPKFQAHTHQSWQIEQPIDLPGVGCLSANKKPVAKGQKPLLKTGLPLTIGWRKGGERCQPAERQHSQQLKKLLQEYGLETWLRDRVPLIYIDGQLAAVADLWVCSEFVASVGENGYELHWDCSSIAENSSD